MKPQPHRPRLMEGSRYRSRSKRELLAPFRWSAASRAQGPFTTSLLANPYDMVLRGACAGQSQDVIVRLGAAFGRTVYG
jgi:hypothetical protein